MLEPKKTNTGWGSQSWTLMVFFQCICLDVLLKLIEGLKKYWLVWAGPLANHLLNFNLIFLSDGLAAERAACFSDLYRS